jgi:hypothetical protein
MNFICILCLICQSNNFISPTLLSVLHHVACGLGIPLVQEPMYSSQLVFAFEYGTLKNVAEMVVSILDNRHRLKEGIDTVPPAPL